MLSAWWDIVLLWIVIYWYIESASLCRVCKIAWNWTKVAHVTINQSIAVASRHPGRIPSNSLQTRHCTRQASGRTALSRGSWCDSSAGRVLGGQCIPLSDISSVSNPHLGTITDSIVQVFQYNYVGNKTDNNSIHAAITSFINITKCVPTPSNGNASLFLAANEKY